MENKNRYFLQPLNLQFFAEGDPAGGSTAETATPAAVPSQAAAQAPTTPAATTPPASGSAAAAQPPAAQPTQKATADMAAAILAAVESANLKKEKAVVKSMAEQYGLTDEEAQEALNAAKAKKAAQLPPEVQKRLEAVTKAANDKLIAADVRTVGAALGLLDADTALLLMTMENVKVSDSGAVTGVKEALEALKQAKPFLFSTQDAKPTGAKTEVGGKIDKSGAATVTKEQFTKMGYKERLALKQKDPALYDELSK